MAELTFPKAAAELGVKDQTLHRWRKAGKIQAHQNALGYWLTDVDAIPRELVERAHSQTSQRKTQTSQRPVLQPEREAFDCEAELARVHELLKGRERQNERLLSIIEQLTGQR